MSCSFPDSSLPLPDDEHNDDDDNDQPLFTILVPGGEETISLVARNQVLIAFEPNLRRLVLTLRNEGSEEGAPTHPCVGILLGERATAQFILTCQNILHEMRSTPLK